MTASPNTTVADGRSSVSLRVVARDRFGNLSPDAAVSMAGLGGNKTFSPSAGAIDANGVFVSLLTFTQVQTQSVTATSDASNNVSTQATFTVRPAVAATSAMTPSPATQVANNSSTMLVTLALRDAQGHPIANQATTFLASGPNTIVSAAAATNAAGQTSATYSMSHLSCGGAA